VAALSLLFRCFLVVHRCYLAINSAVVLTKIEQRQRLTDFVDSGTREGTLYDPLRFAGKDG
jgi:hypothetical protein